MKTIGKAIEELQNTLKDSAKIIAAEFNKKCHDIADNLSSKIDELKKHAKDNKDRSLESIQKQYDGIKENMTEYQKATGKKAEEYHKVLVKKLSELSKKIEDYNNKHKN
ncbi:MULTISPECIES: apolipoprotein A1/A4/E family protein [unclassified Rickettsia]|uniref:apolipoprotein A1/A4/E family protein n=1 Tax=unclassified Rickettsia TaxID=114295 RepID=UPI00209F3576|nr:apolipoprotein A1/A4/E family protein [Rickettsia endosymbiont of Ceutorhynchus assimilis]